MYTLFAYGTLRKSQSNSHFLTHSEFKGLDTVNGFIMLDFGGYPVIFESKVEDSIIVEIYEIDDYTLSQIDALEEYSEESSDENLYFRTIVKSRSGMRGNIYYGKNLEKYMNFKVIESGDWLDRIHK